MPPARAAAGDHWPTGRPCTSMLPEIGCSVPESRPASAAWPLPETPARPVISPLCSVSVTRSSGGPPGRRAVETFSSVSSAGPVISRSDRRRRHLAPDHERGELAARRRGRGALAGELAGAQHQDAVADRHHLGELVRDEDDRQALPDQQLQRGEERIGFGRRQHRRRLVEDQHARVAVERLQDLDALALADRQRRDDRAGIDGEAEFGRRAA